MTRDPNTSLSFGIAENTVAGGTSGKLHAGGILQIIADITILFFFTGIFTVAVSILAFLPNRSVCCFVLVRIIWVSTEQAGSWPAAPLAAGGRQQLWLVGSPVLSGLSLRQAEATRPSSSVSRAGSSPRAAQPTLL